MLCYHNFITCIYLLVFIAAVTVEIAEADFQVREGTSNNMITAQVQFNVALKNEIELRFIPFSYEQFFSQGFTLPGTFPDIGTHAKSEFWLNYYTSHCTCF